MHATVGGRRRTRQDIWHRRGELGFVCSLAVMLGASLTTDAQTSHVAMILAAAFAAVVGIAFVGRFLRLGDVQWSLLLWPVGVYASLLAFSTVAQEAARLLGGLVVLAFLYVGLCQPPGRGSWLLVPAGVILTVTLGFDSPTGMVRVLLGVLACFIASELPARLLRDLHDQHRLLERMATTDPLTGLLNRSSLDAHLDRTLPTSAVVLIDLDHFKQFNDAHGHVAGDQALRAFAAVLADNTRDQDVAFRYGGEEFLLILDRSSTSDASATLARIAETWAIGQSDLTFSAGVSEGGPDALRTADDLLYRAKDDGRSRVRIELTDAS